MTEPNQFTLSLQFTLKLGRKRSPGSPPNLMVDAARRAAK